MKKNVRTNDLKTFERTWKYDRFVYWTKKISKFNSKLSFFGQTHEFLNKLKKRYIFTKRAVSQTNFWKKIDLFTEQLLNYRLVRKQIK